MSLDGHRPGGPDDNGHEPVAAVARELVAREPGPRQPAAREPIGPAAVDCRGLTYRFGEVTAVDDVSFTIAPGEVFGLLGPNGAGKTTTIRILTTLLRPDRGGARVFGHDTATDRMRVRQLLGYVPQQLSADGTLTGWENVWLLARLYDVPRRVRDDRIAEVLDAMGLTAAGGRLVSTYSGGMVRRLELAQALVNRPRLLVLDEPTIGLDPIARSSVWDHVRRLRDESGVTVLLTTHYMEEADELCDRVGLMHRGRLRALGPPAALEAALGPGATLEDVFRHYAGGDLGDDGVEGGFRDVRATRRTARRLG
jgi:ABC-2 type transport system ATP-binding protein